MKGALEGALKGPLKGAWKGSLEVVLKSVSKGSLTSLALDYCQGKEDASFPGVAVAEP